MLSLPVRETRLENGLTLLLLEDHAAPVFTIMLWLPVGGRLERPGITGISHYLEHCYSLGSSKLAPREVDRIVQSLGGQKNAFTSNDYTAYYESLPSAALERIVEVEADRLATLALPADRLASELDVVREERRLRYENSPGGRLTELLLATAFERHPYRFPVIGTSADLARLSREDALAWYRTHYVPANATFVLVGDIRHDDAVALFRRHLGAIEGGERPRVEVEPEPAQTRERRAEARMPSLKLPRIAVLWKAPPLDHPDTVALNVLQTALFEGDAARFDRVLRRERKLVTGVGGGLWEMRDAGPFTLEAECMEGVAVEEVERAAEEAIDDVVSRGIGEEELRRARASIELTFLAGLESTAARARAIGRYHVTSARGWRWLEDYVERVREVTREDVRRVAEGLFRAEGRTVARIVPGEERREGGRGAVAGAGAGAGGGGGGGEGGEGAGGGSGEGAGSGGGVVGEEWGDARRWGGEGGPLVLFQRVAKLPTVAVAIQARAGSAFDPPGRAGLATAVLETLRCGTASLDEEALAARFADLGASLGVSRGPDCVGVGTTVLARDLERALALLAEVALRPSFPLEKLERTRRELLAEKASAAARAEELLVEAFYAALYGGGHPYELPMNGTPATLAAIGREDVLRLHAERWRPESLTLAVVGDVEGARVRAAVEACLGGARAAAPLPGAGLSAAAPRPRPRLVIVDKPDQTQAHVRVGLPAIARADPDFDALALANVVLGGGGLASRITDVVRTRNGLAYSAGSVVVSRVLPAPFAAVAQTRIETAARAVELILAEVERIGTEPIPEDELSRARALFTGALPFRLETNAQKAGALLEGAAYSLGPDHLRRQIERVQALTAAEVREAARRRLRPAEMTIVAVGPREPLARELARFDGPPIAPEPAAAGAPA